MSREQGAHPIAALSVVVPTRNRAHWLPDCLKSLCEESSEADVEVIVVDNGSSDSTADVVADWADRDPRIRRVYEARPGRSVALNAGIDAASGSLLLFTDDDVIVQPGWIAAFRTFFDAHPNELVLAGGPIHNVPSDLQPWPEWLGTHPMSEVGSLEHGPQVQVLERHEQLWGANVAAPRDLFRRLGGWDESLGVKAEERGTYEDLEMQERVRVAGGAVWYVPGAVIHHRVDPDKVTPRSVLFRAFHGGVSAATWARHREEAGTVKPIAEEALQVAWHLAAWSTIALALHLVRRPGAIQRGRRAAQRAGWHVGIVDGLAQSVSRTPASLAARACRAIARPAAFGVVARLAPPR